MTKLKACPFCGEECISLEEYIFGEGQHIATDKYSCINDDCPATNGAYTLPQWQTRPLEDALQKRIEGLEILSSAGNLASDCAMEYRDELGKLRQSLKKAIKEIMDKFGDEISISDVGDKTAMSNVTKKGVGLELALVVLKKHGLIESEEK